LWLSLPGLSNQILQSVEFDRSGNDVFAYNEAGRNVNIGVPVAAAGFNDQDLGGGISLSRLARSPPILRL